MSADHLFPSTPTEIQKLSEIQIKAWTNLAEKTMVANPFFEPQCQLPATRELSVGRSTRLVVAEGHSGLQACLPLMTVNARWGPFRRREAHSRAVGMGTAISLASPLISAETPTEAVDNLLSSFRRWSREGGPGIVVLDWIDDDEIGTGREFREACVRRRMPLYERRTWERPIIRRTSDGLSLRTTLSKKSLTNLNRHQRRLEEALGGSAQLVDRADDPAAVDEFLRLEASGWKRHDGGAIAVRSDTEKWFRTVCANFNSLGRLHLLSLEVLGRTVAMLCCFRSDEEAFLFRVGHDAELNTHGPGVLVHVAGVEYLEGLGVDVVDTCADPNNEFLARLYPDRRHLATIVIGTGGLVDRSIVRAMPALMNRGRSKT